jgi:crotonobetainyl-CoA:carnitine CoA-transferase CaiB-like acyl-CoA transferase
MLEPYRVLDLTDVRGQIAGMMLGDLGADVIRVEPLGGSAARQVGPFLDSGPELERSLSFAAYNRNKRSVELDFGSAEGTAALEALIRGADFVIDSGPPALLEKAGFDFEALRTLNPQIVQVRISAFGSDGPHADLPAADLTVAAMGGPVGLQGDPDRPPVRLSVPQAWRHAGAEAAVAALVGHARMRSTGEGVFVDVSAQLSMTWTMLNAMAAHAIQHEDFERGGSALQLGNATYQLVFECADGHLICLPRGPLIVSLAEWMLEDGVIDQAFLDREDWSTYDARVIRGETLVIPAAEVIDRFEQFFRLHTKTELFDRGLALGATLAPVQTLDDLLGFEQLKDRGYFIDLELPSGQRVKAPGAFVKLSSGTVQVADRPAPTLGAHTNEVLQELAQKPRVRVVGDAKPTALPFEGLKVADFSWVGVGPISGKYLADHGADVIRVEWEGRPDALRTAGPFMDGKTGWNRSHFYGEFNTSKRCLALDLKNERSREVTGPLLEWADVILESFTPGAVDRVGIGYETARAANPGVVMVSSCLMGQTGPAAAMAGYGYHAAGVAGFYELAGWPDRPPAGPWNAYTDTIAPRFLVTTLLSALDHQRRTGEGRHIDLGQMEASLHFLAPEILARQATGEVFTRAGNRSPDAAPQGLYPTEGEEQWCAIAIENDAHWESLCELLGDPDWARAPGLETVPGRLAAHDEIDRQLASWTRSRALGELVPLLNARGIPAAPLQRSSNLLADPQLAHRGFHHYLEHEEMGRVPYSGHQFRISGYESGPRSPAPLLGGNSFEVLSETLGLDGDVIADLVASGAIG